MAGIAELLKKLKELKSGSASQLEADLTREPNIGEKIGAGIQDVGAVMGQFGIERRDAPLPEAGALSLLGKESENRKRKALLDLFKLGTEIDKSNLMKTQAENLVGKETTAETREAGVGVKVAAEGRKGIVKKFEEARKGLAKSDVKESWKKAKRDLLTELEPTAKTPLEAQRIVDAIANVAETNLWTSDSDIEDLKKEVKKSLGGVASGEASLEESVAKASGNSNNNSGQGQISSPYSPQQEIGIKNVMKSNNYTREQALAALKKAGKL